MFGIGASELLIIFLFALLFIGPKKLPELAKGLGKGIREFQKAKDDLMDQVNTPAPTETKSENIEKEDTVQEVTAVSKEDEESSKSDA
jgi:TatA/E family protein of Tat protein translocase